MHVLVLPISQTPLAQSVPAAQAAPTGRPVHVPPGVLPLLHRIGSTHSRSLAHVVRQTAPLQR
jgi:hypothetical protein